MCVLGSIEGGGQESLPPVGVFWDIENCAVPSGRSAATVVQRLRERFFQGHREAEFICVCDISKENKAVIQELNNCQVHRDMHAGKEKNFLFFCKMSRTFTSKCLQNDKVSYCCYFVVIIIDYYYLTNCFQKDLNPLFHMYLDFFPTVQPYHRSLLLT